VNKTVYAVIGLGMSICVQGATVFFDFNGLSAGANNGQIQTWMQSELDKQLGAGVATVTVAGAIADKGSGTNGTGNNGVVNANQTGYNGEGHVVGSNSGNPTSLTLGNSNGCILAAAAATSNCTAGTADTYIHNVSGTFDQITMTFTGFNITNAEFDGQIFPDGGCTILDGSGKQCGGATDPNKPDFTFKANGTTVFQKFGVSPGTGGTYSRSPLGAETAPQALFTGSWSFASSQTLAFMDWPATIGLDNLRLTGTVPSPVPEPTSILLLGTLAGGLLLLRRRTRNA
jgi:hypothetical protein